MNNRRELLKKAAIGTAVAVTLSGAPANANAVYQKLTFEQQLEKADFETRMDYKKMSAE